MSNPRVSPVRYPAKENRLLAMLPAEERRRIAIQLELVQLPLGRVLYEAGSKLPYVYFPLSGLVSLLNIMENGDPAEVAAIGNDGMVGVRVLLGGGSAISRAVVQIAGEAYRMKAEAIVEAFRRPGPLHDLLLRYVQALMTQMSQTAVCNRHHSIEQRLCRWLLLSLDRIGADEIAMTQERIGLVLGVRRVGITAAARKLHEAGLIAYRRGHIIVSDRAKLQAYGCECYAVIASEMDRLLS